MAAWRAPRSLPADGQGPDRILDPVVVDQVAAVARVGAQAVPQAHGVGHGLTDGAFGVHHIDLRLDPLLQLVEYRHGFPLSVLVALVRRIVAFIAGSFDGVEVADPAQDVFGAGLVVVQSFFEVASCVGHAGQCDDALPRSELLVARVAVGLQGALEVLQHCGGELGAAARANASKVLGL